MSDKILNILSQNRFAFGQLFPAVYDQILKNNLAIWSHCSPHTPSPVTFLVFLHIWVSKSLFFIMLRVPFESDIILSFLSLSLFRPPLITSFCFFASRLIPLTWPRERTTEVQASVTRFVKILPLWHKLECLW